MNEFNKNRLIKKQISCNIWNVLSASSDHEATAMTANAHVETPPGCSLPPSTFSHSLPRSLLHTFLDTILEDLLLALHHRARHAVAAFCLPNTGTDDLCQRL